MSELNLPFSSTPFAGADTLDALINMARQIVLLLALACSCAGFRAPAAAGRATRPALSRRAWKIAMDENNDPKAAETNAEATDGSGNLR